MDEESKNMEDRLKSEDWYVLNDFVGTKQERDFINFFERYINELEEKYDEVYLIRNEEKYKIYELDEGKGRGFQPDFILYLKEKEGRGYKQVLIEPKGEHLLDKDAWKNDFLGKITERYDNRKLNDGLNKYSLIGLPLYNSNNDREFRKIFMKKILS